MSVASLSHVWDAGGLTCEEKLLLLWIANADGGLGYPVCPEWVGMGAFIGGDFADADRVVQALHEKGFVHWGEEADDQSHLFWLSYDGPYREPPDWGETKKRSKRVLLLLDRDGAGCRYCGTVPIDYHLDHVIPKSRGGPDTLENLVLSCPPCNIEKGARTPAEWRGH